MIKMMRTLVLTILAGVITFLTILVITQKQIDWLLAIVPVMILWIALKIGDEK